LDLFELLTLAEEVRDDPAGALLDVRVNLNQIVKKCERDDVEQVMELAGQIREARDLGLRATLAGAMVEELARLLAARDAEVVSIEAA
jgi:hypothetical protein